MALETLTPAPAPEPDPYMEARSAYAKQKESLMGVQRKLMEELEGRRIQPAERLMSFSQAMLTPGRTGSFGEAFGGAMGNLQKMESEDAARAQAIAKMRLEMGMQQLGVAKEDLALALEQRRLNALKALEGGGAGVATPQGIESVAAKAGLTIPKEAWALVKGMDSENAIKTLTNFVLKNAETPDAVKAVNAFVGMLPPNLRAAAAQARASTELFGKPEDAAKAIIDIRTAVRQGVMSPEEGEKQIANLSNRISNAPSAPVQESGDVIPSKISGKPEEVMSRLMNIKDPNVRKDAMLSYLKQLETSGPMIVSEKQTQAEVSPVRVSPAQESEIEATRRKLVMEEQLKERQKFRQDANEASGIIETANAVFDIVQKQPGAFRVFNKPGIASAVGKLVENGIRVGSFTVGINDLKDAVRTAGGTQEEINAVSAVQQYAINASLKMAQLSKGQGAVSNFERDLFQKATYDVSDSPEMIKYKSELLRARGEFDKFRWTKYKEFEKATKGSVEDFLDSPQYEEYKKQYDVSLKRIRDTYIK